MQEIIAARVYYDADHAMMVCRSGFTDNARVLAVKAHTKVSDGVVSPKRKGPGVKHDPDPDH